MPGMDYPEPGPAPGKRGREEREVTGIREPERGISEDKYRFKGKCMSEDKSKFSKK